MFPKSSPFPCKPTPSIHVLPQKPLKTHRSSTWRGYSGFIYAAEVNPSVAGLRMSAGVILSQCHGLSNMEHPCGFPRLGDEGSEERSLSFNTSRFRNRAPLHALQRWKCLQEKHLKLIMINCNAHSCAGSSPHCAPGSGGCTSGKVSLCQIDPRATRTAL